ncbi:proton-conducting transporter transmembrane domain-containing protein [Gimesia fumaroli]|uniref:NADH-quinone oxidoreductase subunit M n=1 Tax=Gimesia fumaroli TaxID=2527976 RepID=A0A518I6W8_9PLAN|nr:proton-conducting transporter membrane subunit [Gimesia fumaroli]QDV48820.1 NADH-quinone oxidoreductase subunit M [Gimesia fumaroli]
MNSFLNAIIPLSPVLLVVMPVIGACFGWGASRLGLEFTRWTAFSNSLVSCLILAAVMFSPFLQTDEDDRPTRAISVTLKLPATETASAEERNERVIKWALDATAVWFLLLPTCLWPVLTLLIHRMTDVSQQHYFLLMLLQALLAGLFVSFDLLSFLTFLMLTTFCLLCLIRLASGSRSRSVFESTMYLQFLGDGLIMGGLLLAATGHTWMQGVLLEGPQPLTLQFESILQGTVSDVSLYPVAQAYWSTVSPWIFLMLLSGFVIKGALFPVHYQLTQWLKLLPAQAGSAPEGIGWYLVLLTLITKVSIYGMVRFLVPLTFSVGTSVSSLLALWGSFGFLIAALIASLRKDLLTIVVWFLIGQTSLVLTILFAADATAVSQYLSWNLIQGLACCLLFLVLPLIGLEQQKRTHKLFMGIAGLSLLTLLGMPGLGGFTAGFALLWSLANQGVLLALSFLLGSLLFNLALIRGFWRLMKVDQPTELPAVSATPVRSHENIGLTWLAFSPLVLLIVVLGIAPATLLEQTLLPLISVSESVTEEPAEN